MSFEVKTPALVYAMDLVKTAMADLDSGTAEIKAVNAKVGGAREVRNIVKADVTTRMNANKIHAQEARIIEGRAPPAVSDQSGVA